MQANDLLLEFEKLAEQELSFLQNNNLTKVEQISEKRKAIWDELMQQDLSPMQGIREKLLRLQSLQSTLSKEAKQLRNILQKELNAIQRERYANSTPYHKSTILIPFKKRFETQA